MEKIKIIYVDDRHDEILSRYLSEGYTKSGYEIEHEDILFDPNAGYESLLKNPSVVQANIVIIDSRLFESATACEVFTGEEFKVVLKKYYPFIEVIVITQNDADTDVGTISKYDPALEIDGNEYYKNELPKYIDKAIHNISIFRKLVDRVENNSIWEPFLKDKIAESLQGSNKYDDLTKSDIDSLISAFKEIQVKFDE